ncbi:MAG: peptidoglycan DD-metalloendopeptidase family protein [Zetaproteobacteria bacterium]|nr:peptidoglycan DD-metalloendopeptidase family protein [Zetaproteobacteria bacterium]
MVSFSAYRRLNIVLFASFLFSFQALPLWADEQKVQGELQDVRAQREQVQRIQADLEAKLSVVSQDMAQLDQTLKRARADLAATQKDVKRVAALLLQHEKRVAALQHEVDQLQRDIEVATSAAYQRAGREPSWLDLIVGGTSVVEIPHQKKMLSLWMQSLEKDRQALLVRVAQLNTEKASVVERQKEVLALKAQKEAMKQQVSQQKYAKKAMVVKIKKDVTLQQQREKELRMQEKALLTLLEELDHGLQQQDKVEVSLDVRKQKGTLQWPLKGKIVQSFGSKILGENRSLSGVRIRPARSDNAGREVKAIAAGQVRFADWFGGYGLMMVVDHGDGLMTVYAHNDELYKHAGDWVQVHEVVAKAGTTGWVENMQLLFEVRDRGKPVNPKLWCH